MTSKTIDGVSRELLQKLDDLMYIMTGHDSYPRLIHKYGKEWWTPVNELRAEVCTLLAAPEAPRQSEAVAVAWLDRESGAIVTDKLKPLLCESGFDIPLYAAPLSPDHSGGGAGMVLPEGWMLVPLHPTMDMLDALMEWNKVGNVNAYNNILNAAQDYLDKVKELNQ